MGGRLTARRLGTYCLQPTAYLKADESIRSIALRVLGGSSNPKILGVRVLFYVCEKCVSV